LNTAATIAGRMTVAATISGPMDLVKSPTAGGLGSSGDAVTTRIMNAATVQIAHSQPAPTIARPIIRHFGSIAPAFRSAVSWIFFSVRAVSGAIAVAIRVSAMNPPMIA
jgi:hypothetical protein